MLPPSAELRPGQTGHSEAITQELAATVLGLFDDDVKGSDQTARFVLKTMME